MPKRGNIYKVTLVEKDESTRQLTLKHVAPQPKVILDNRKAYVLTVENMYMVQSYAVYGGLYNEDGELVDESYEYK